MYDPTDDVLVGAGKQAPLYLQYDNSDPSFPFGTWDRLACIPEEDKVDPVDVVFPERSPEDVAVPDHLYHVRCANIRSGLHADA